MRKTSGTCERLTDPRRVGQAPPENLLTLDGQRYMSPAEAWALLRTDIQGLLELLRAGRLLERPESRAEHSRVSSESLRRLAGRCVLFLHWHYANPGVPLAAWDRTTQRLIEAFAEVLNSGTNSTALRDAVSAGRALFGEERELQPKLSPSAAAEMAAREARIADQAEALLRHTDGFSAVTPKVSDQVQALSRPFALWQTPETLAADHIARMVVGAGQGQAITGAGRKRLLENVPRSGVAKQEPLPAHERTATRTRVLTQRPGSAPERMPMSARLPAHISALGSRRESAALVMALRSFRDSAVEVSGAWEEFGSSAPEALTTDYPFHRDFAELAHAINTWAEKVEGALPVLEPKRPPGLTAQQPTRDSRERGLPDVGDRLVSALNRFRDSAFELGGAWEVLGDDAPGVLTTYYPFHRDFAELSHEIAHWVEQVERASSDCQKPLMVDGIDPVIRWTIEQGGLRPDELRTVEDEYAADRLFAFRGLVSQQGHSFAALGQKWTDEHRDDVSAVENPAAFFRELFFFMLAESRAEGAMRTGVEHVDPVVIDVIVRGGLQPHALGQLSEEEQWKVRRIPAVLANGGLSWLEHARAHYQGIDVYERFENGLPFDAVTVDDYIELFRYALDYTQVEAEEESLPARRHGGTSRTATLERRPALGGIQKSCSCIGSGVRQERLPSNRSLPPHPDPVRAAKNAISTFVFVLTWPGTAEQPLVVTGASLLEENDFGPEDLLELGALQPGQTLAFGGGAAVRVEVRRLREDESLPAVRRPSSSALSAALERCPATLERCPAPGSLASGSSCPCTSERCPAPRLGQRGAILERCPAPSGSTLERCPAQIGSKCACRVERGPVAPDSTREVSVDRPAPPPFQRRR